MNLQSLAQEIYAINKANGWHDGEPRSWAEICMLIESEIGGEAVEALRSPLYAVDEIWYGPGGKPEGFVTEIADGVIRLLDGMVEKGEVIWGTYSNVTIRDSIHNIRALSKLTHQLEDHLNRTYCASVFCSIAFEMILELGHDPENVIREKMAYNKTRGDRHGGKRL